MSRAQAIQATWAMVARMLGRVPPGHLAETGQTGDSVAHVAAIARRLAQPKAKRRGPAQRAMRDRHTPPAVQLRMWP